MFGRVPGKGLRVFAASFVVFAVLNLLENLLNYSIGRTSLEGTREISFQMPSYPDWIKIVVVMMVFGILQGFFTCLIAGC